MRRIMVVEDDLSLQQTLAGLFRGAGFEVELVGDGGEALKLFQAIRPHAVVLDLQLPNVSGEDICRYIKRRSPSIPTIILSAKSDETDVVSLLQIGAEDYVTKPFSPKALLARVSNAMSRAANASSSDVCMFGNIVVDFATMELKREKETVLLSPQEWKLLAYLCQNPGRVISRDELLNQVWGHDRFPTTRTVDNHILKLRQKLEKDPAHPVHFKTVHTFGYIFSKVDE